MVNIATENLRTPMFNERWGALHLGHSRSIYHPSWFCSCPTLIGMSLKWFSHLHWGKLEVERPTLCWGHLKRWERGRLYAHYLWTCCHSKEPWIDPAGARLQAPSCLTGDLRHLWRFHLWRSRDDQAQLTALQLKPPGLPGSGSSPSHGWADL